MRREILTTTLVYFSAAVVTAANCVLGAHVFNQTVANPIVYVGSLLAPLLLAFAAALIGRRPLLASSLAVLSALLSLPWFYLSESGILALVNSWILFNLPDRELHGQSLLPIVLRILSVALLVLSLTVALFRLIPTGWRIGKSPVREWTWPGLVTSLAVLAFWFLGATTPYRIPGAVDYMDYPTFQILHIEKHGLRIREKCLSLYQRRDGTRAYFSADDRRLFRYRFDTNGTTIPISQDLDLRVRAWTQAAGHPGWDASAQRPLRSSTAEGWYVSAANFGFQSYTTENGRVAPSEIPAIFHSFEQVSASFQPSGQLKDVCLGFCFDPPAAMGRLYSNHRCFNDGKSVKCRLRERQNVYPNCFPQLIRMAT